MYELTFWRRLIMKTSQNPNNMLFNSNQKRKDDIHEST